MEKCNGKIWYFKREKVHCMVERAKSMLWERKRCKCLHSIHYERQEQTKGSYLEKRIKRHSQTCFSGREKKFKSCWKQLGKRWKKGYFGEWWKSEKKKNGLSKIWLKRSLSGERSMTLIKQRKHWHLEEQGVNNLWCGKGFDSYVEGAF